MRTPDLTGGYRFQPQTFAAYSPSGVSGRSSVFTLRKFLTGQDAGGVDSPFSKGPVKPNGPYYPSLALQNESQYAQKPAGSAVQSGSPGHIFWVVPAFQVDYSKNIKPLTSQEKFGEWARGAYDPLGLAWGAAESAAEHSSRDGFCGYGNGWGGYGKCFGSAELDANISSFFGDYLFPVLMHQDPRYFRLGHGSFGKRLFYAISRVFVTRTDSGGTAIDYSALAGTVLAAGTSNLYYPQQDRGFGLTLSRIGWDLGGTALYDASAEFWPDIKQRIYHVF